MAVKQKRKFGKILYYVCLVLLVLLLVAACCGTLLFWKAKNLCLKMTDDRPRSLPETVLPVGEYETLGKKVEGFMAAARQGEPHEPLVLGEREVNALLAQNMGLQSIQGKVYVAFFQNHFHAFASIPLRKMPWRAIQPRYVNGTGVFSATLQNGVLIVCAEALWIKGQRVPPVVMNRLKSINLAKEAYKDVDTAQMLSRVKSLQIKDGALTVELFPAQGP